MGERGPVPGHVSRLLERAWDRYGDPTYRMSCICGWRGPQRQRKHDADNDLVEHLAPFRDDPSVRPALVIRAEKVAKAETAEAQAKEQARQMRLDEAAVAARVSWFESQAALHAESRRLEKTRDR